MDKSNIKIMGNVFAKGSMAGTNIDYSTNWVALCKIKSNPLAMSDTNMRGKFFIRVFRMGTAESWYRDIIVSVISSTSVSDSVTILQRSPRNSTGLSVVLHKEGNYWVLYAKGNNQYDNISYQLLYATYPSFLTDIHENITVSVATMTGYPSQDKVTPADYYTVTVTPVTHASIDVNSWHNVYFMDDDGMVTLNMGFSTDGALPITMGTTIATISKSPITHNLIVALPWFAIDNSSSGVIPGIITTGGSLIAKGSIPANSFIGLNIKYKSINNSLT